MKYRSQCVQPMLIVLLSLVTYLSVLSVPLAHGSAPNVLFIAVDDLRPQLKSYGHSTMHTPNLDKLASEGFLFTRAYVQEALCSPSRTSLLTGLRPDTTAIYGNTTHFRDTVPWVTTMPQHFMDHGYYAAAIGKIYHSGLNDADSWSEPHVAPGGYYWYALEENQAIKETYGKGPPTESANVPDTVYRDGQLTRDAIGKLSELKNRQPFLYMVGYVRPHLPFSAPTSYWDLYDRDTDLELPTTRHHAQDAPEYAYTSWGELRSFYGMPAAPYPVTLDQEKTLIHGYYASVSFVDKLIGELLVALDNQGLADNTIVVVWGDHGWHLGEQGQWSKYTNFERDTRNALLMRIPQLVGNVVIDRLIETVDLYPTLAELSGLPVPSWLQGQSFTALLYDPELPGDADALSQIPRGSMMGYSLRTERYRYTEWRDRYSETVKARELYDHEYDPGEDFNVAGRPEYTSTVNLLSNQLTERLNEYAEDPVYCGGKLVTILGTEDHDVISGTAGPDIIHGLGGNDVIDAQAGDDIVCGGDGNDTLGGQLGNDKLYGDDGNDTLWGGAGNDELWGGSGNDTLGGGWHNDKLYGDYGNDTLWGGAGNDELWGGNGIDILEGAAGDDILRGNAGNDTLRGGDGIDELYAGWGNDTCYDDAGTLAEDCEVLFIP